jgi:general secretion pathway protein I
MKQHGFTLLEAIVAIVLIATTGMALLSWINTNLIALNRVQDVQRRNESIRNALNFIDTLNPMLKPEGEQTLGIYTFKWHSTEIDPSRNNVNSSGYDGYYLVALYNIELAIYIDNAPISIVNAHQIGYKQIYFPSEDLF